MQKERIELVQTIESGAAQKELAVRTRLVEGITLFAQQRSSLEINNMSNGAAGAQTALVRNVPLIAFLRNGGLKFATEVVSRDDVAALESKVEKLSLPLVEDASGRIDSFCTLVNSINTAKTARRIRAYTDFFLPDTKEAFEALRVMTKKFAEKFGLPKGTVKGSLITEVIKVLGECDENAEAVIRKNAFVMAEIDEVAKDLATVALPDILAKDSVHAKKLRVKVAAQKMFDLRRDANVDPKGKARSRFEEEVNKVIEEENLKERAAEALAIQNADTSEKKEARITFLARERVAETIVRMMENDELVRGEFASRNQLTPDELIALPTEEKQRIAKNIVTARRIILSQDKRRVIYPSRMVEAEKDAVRKIVENDTSEETRIKANLPKENYDRAIWALGIDQLQARLETEATADEMLFFLTQEIADMLIAKKATFVVDQAVKKLGIEKDPQTSLPRLTSEAMSTIIAEVKAMINPEGPSSEKPYAFTVPDITIGKSQLVSPINLLRFATSVTTAQTPDSLSLAVATLIASSEEFDGYFGPDETASAYSAGRKMEMLFSMVGRGAGSKLAGTPLFELRNDTVGLSVRLDQTRDRIIRIDEQYGERFIRNETRLSPLIATVGNPYVDRLTEATKKVADAIDTVSKNAEKMLGALGRPRISVEEATARIKSALPMLLEKSEGAHVGRPLLQMDYFLLYDAKLRRKIFETFQKTGSLDELMPELAQATTDGNLQLAIFDISGGAGGVGITEILSRDVFGRSSGHMKSYIDALVNDFEERTGKKPKSIVIAPREADLTLMNFEYTVFERAIQSVVPDVEVGITTLEILEQSIAVSNQSVTPLTVPTIKGTVVTPDLVVKRFTFAGEGRGTGDRGDVLLTLPDGVVLLPTSVSRIVASDKRINSRIIDAIAPTLEQEKVDILPFIDIPIENDRIEDITEKIVGFMRANVDKYPDIAFLGAVLKTGDKIPGREGSAGEVISAYPVPASVMENREMQRLFIGKKIRELTLKGVTGIIVQPNVLSLVVDSNGILCPKFELKMMAFAKRKEKV